MGFRLDRWSVMHERRAEAQEHQASRGDLPVTFSENEIAVAFVPLASCLEIELAFHPLLRVAHLRNVATQC